MPKNAPLWLSLVLLFAGSSLFAQASPCLPGTMANVVGTSCSIGSIVFTFQNDFSGSALVLTQGVPSFQTITPAGIGFIPIQSGDQVGFKLILNFADGPGPDSNPNNSAGRFIQFSYAPQAEPGTEIRVQNLSMDASVQGAPSDSASVSILDFQDYANAGLLFTATGLDNEQGTLVNNKLSDNEFLRVPAIVSTGSGSPGVSTTELSDSASGVASASLASATFLYTTQPFVVAPRLASLTYTNIDLAGAARTIASTINNEGTIVGSFTDAAGASHGYTADTAGNFTPFDAPGAAATSGLGLNERGDIVGSFKDADGNTHGFLFDKKGSFSTLDFPGSLFTAAVAINNDGEVAGEYESADRGFHGFVLDSGVFTSIDHGPGVGLFASTEAFAINNSGEVAGTFVDPQTFRSFMQRKDVVDFIDVPGQGFTILFGLNDRGDSVGIYDDFNVRQHGFVRSQSGFQTVDFPAGSNTSALGTNASGAIVGQYLGTDGRFHSFLALPAIDNGQDQQPDTSATIPAQTKPDCSDEQWRRSLAQRIEVVSCRFPQ